MVEGIKNFDFRAVQTHRPGCVHCAICGWRHVAAADRICSECRLDVGEGFFNDTETQEFLTMDIIGVEDTVNFRNVLATRLDLALTGYFDNEGKVRALNLPDVNAESHREMQLLAWISRMLEALESGEEDWSIVSPETL